MTNIYKTIHDIGIIPIVEKEDVLLTVKALCDGGLPIVEITYSNLRPEVIKKIKEVYSNILVGVNIKIKEEVDSLINEGVDYVATENVDVEIIEYCKNKDVVIIPKISSINELEEASSLGLEVVKLQVEDVDVLKSLHDSFKDIKFITSGNIDESNINTYLKEASVLACASSSMMSEDLSKTEELTKSLVKKMLNITLKHVGINEENDDGALIAQQYAKLFDGKVRQTSKGWFGSDYVEIMSSKLAMGKHGHIGIGTNNPDRARRYYKSIGYEFDESTAGYDNEGNLKVIYFKDELGGFRFHLVKN